MHNCKQKQNKDIRTTCWPHDQIRLASKAVFHFQYIISFACLTKMSKHCKNKQYFTCLECILWAIPQDDRMVNQIWSDKTTAKFLLSCKYCVLIS